MNKFLKLTKKQKEAHSFITKEFDIPNIIENKHFSRCFGVVAVETGIGKTEALKIAAASIYFDRYIGNYRNMLIVVEHKDSANLIRMGIMNKIFEIKGSYQNDEIIKEDKQKQDVIKTYPQLKTLGIDIAELKENIVVVHAENYREYESKLKDIPILIITHKRYKDAYMKKEMEERLKEGREILVIDEEVDLLDILKYNNEYINYFSMLLPESIRNIYSKVVEEIKSAISYKVNDKIEVIQLVENKEQEFKKLYGTLVSNLTEEYIQEHIGSFKDYAKYLEKFMYIKIAGADYETEKFVHNIKDYALKEVYRLRRIYMNKCFKERDSLYSYNSDINYWMLEGEEANNIILDANAVNRSIYINNPTFSIISFPKMKDYSNWKCNLVKLNTSISSREAYSNYEEETLNYILQQREKRTLIIGNQNDRLNGMLDVLHKKGEAENIAYDYFNNIRGKNEYSDYEQVYIITTPNISYSVYLMIYSLYRNTDITNEENLKITRGKFESLEFEDIRIDYLAFKIYQAINRIGRNKKSIKTETAVFLFCNNEAVIAKLKELIDFNEEKDISYLFNIKRDEQADDELDVKFIDILQDINQNKDKYRDKGIIYAEDLIKISKQYIRGLLNIDNKKNFARDVLDKSKVINYMEHNNIKMNQHYVIIQLD